MRNPLIFLSGAFLLTGWASAANLCEGLAVNDKTPHSVPSVTKPALGESYVDPTFGTTVRRISDVAGTYGENTGVIKPAYSTMPAWNADESYLVLYHVGGGHMLLDGKNYQFLRYLDIDPPDFEQFYWDTTDPDAIYYVDNNRYASPALVRFHVSTSNREVVHLFSGCTGTLSGGDDPVFNSWNPNRFSFTCTSPRGLYIYDVASDQVIGKWAGSDPLAGGTPEPPKLGSKGERTLWNRAVTDSDLNYIGSLGLGDPYNHASLGRRADGHDVYMTVNFDAPNREGCYTPEPADCPNATLTGDEDDYVGQLAVYDLDSASNPILPQVIIGSKTGYPYPQSIHLSGVTFKNPGWALVTVADRDTSPSATALLDRELVYANLDTGDVCRIAHHRSFSREGPRGYWAEAHGVPSPTGTRVLFGSDWGGGTTVDAYVVELPGYTGETDLVPPAKPRGLRVR